MLSEAWRRTLSFDSQRELISYVRRPGGTGFWGREGSTRRVNGNGAKPASIKPKFIKKRLALHCHRSGLDIEQDGNA